MSEQNQKPDNNAQADKMTEKEWIAIQRGAVLRYCSNKDLNVTDFVASKSAILPPLVAIWYVEAKQTREAFWVISGDLPVDHVPANVAKTPRDVIKHFSLSWQLKAERLMQNFAQGKPPMGSEKEQIEFANLLVNRAEGLHELAEKDEFWGNQGA